MKDAIPCTLRCVHPPKEGRVAIAFNKDDSDEVYRLTIPEDQVNALIEMLRNTTLNMTSLQGLPVDRSHQDQCHLKG